MGKHENSSNLRVLVSALRAFSLKCFLFACFRQRKYETSERRNFLVESDILLQAQISIEGEGKKSFLN